MDVSALRDFMIEHPLGMEVHMVDGTVYRIPHRDYISFVPEGKNGTPGKEPTRFASAFYVHSEGRTRLVNALLVAYVRPFGEIGPRTRRKSD